MPPKKNVSKKVESSCVCGGNCRENHPHLPGLLLAAIGLVTLPINYDMIPGLEWARAWPLLLVLIGVVLAVRVTICQSRS